MHAAEDALNQLKAFIVPHEFASKEEEIHFFKHTKPQFVSRLIYYNKVYHLETSRPQGSRKAVKRYLKSTLHRTQDIWDYQLDFYRYYRSGNDLLDHSYFLRQPSQHQPVKDLIYCDTDPRFTTVHDHTVAQILAHRLLLQYIERELQALNKKATTDTPTATAGMKWTASKASMVELIYGLYSQGAFNAGHTDIKEMAAFFEQVFQIELGDYYRCFLSIRTRKTGRTKFLDDMRNTLLKRMEEQDEKW